MVRKALVSLPGPVVADSPVLDISSNTRTGNDKKFCISPETPPDIPGTLPDTGTPGSWFPGRDGGGVAPPGTAPLVPLDSFNHKSAKAIFRGERYHPLAFREFCRERASASVRVRGIDAKGAPYTASVPCNYRWMDHIRQRDLAVIYSWVEYIEEAGYDSAEVAFMTLTVRHPSRHTYPAASACIDDLRRGWSLISRDIRRSGLEYLRVIEPGERNGFAHYHLILAGASEAVCESLVGRWCSVVDARPAGQDYSVVVDIRQTGAYIAKYLSKTLDSELDYRWLELCYRRRVRTFSMSRASRSYIAAKYRNPLKGLGTLGDACMSWSLTPDEGISRGIDEVLS